MNFGVLSTIASSMMNITHSSVFTRFVCTLTLRSAINNAANFIFGIIYNIAKYMLYFMDLMFSYIQKLAGLDMSMNSLDEMISAESDIVFNFLLSGRDLVTTIIRNLIVLATVLIIVFTIVAIIKGQYQAFKKGSETSPVDAIKSMFKAFVLMLVSPFIAIGGIIMADLVLQAFYNATNISGAMSLGTQVFLSSSTSANAYRLYAQNNQKIPITFDGSKNKDVFDYFDENTITDGFVKYLQESKDGNLEVNPIYATYMTFMAHDFTDFSSVNTIVNSNDDFVKNTKEIYDKYYDFYVGGNGKPRYNTFSDLRRIESYAEEYYVMADVVDFCVKTANTVHIETIEQMLDRICSLSNSDEKERVFQRLHEQYEIQYYSTYTAEAGLPENSDVVVENTNDYQTKVKGQDRLIVFNSDYMSVDEQSGEPDIRMQIPVMHVVGATDEILGAKFIITVDKQITNADGTIEYYTEPLVNGYANNFNTEFKSDHIRNGNIIVAKGIFKDSIYPTAIRTMESPESSRDKTSTTDIFRDVEFYREDIEGQAVGQMGDYLSFSVEPESGGFFGKIFKLIKSLFDPSELVPKIEVDFDAMQLAYEISDGPTIVDTLLEGELRIGYFMKYTPTYPTVKAANNFKLSFTELYSASKLNFLLLVVGSFLLLRVCLSGLSSLIERAYELFLMFIIYPAACASMPLDDGESYSAWLKGFIGRLFRTYGFILGINFVLLMFPVIQQIELFSQAEVGTSKIIRRIGTLFFSVMTIREITNMLNFVVCILLELVAFTLIETVPDVISSIAFGQESALKVKENNVFTKIKDTAVKFGKIAGKIIMPPIKMLEYVWPGKHKKERRKRIKSELKRKALDKMGLSALNQMDKFIPGRAFDQERKRKKALLEAQQERNEKDNELFQKLDDPNSTKEDIKKAVAEYMAASSKTANADERWKCSLHTGKVYRTIYLSTQNEDALQKFNKMLATITDPDEKARLEAEKDDPTKGPSIHQIIHIGSVWYCPDCAKESRATPLKKVTGDDGGGKDGGKEKGTDGGKDKK